MKKKTTNRSWLLGLLVGLVMLVGAGPALASYYFVGNLCSGEFTYNSITYSYTQSQNLNTTPAYVNEFEKFEQAKDGEGNEFDYTEGGSLWNANWEATHSTAASFTTTDKWSGTWDSGTTDIVAYIVKGGSCGEYKNGYVALYVWTEDGNGNMNSGTFNVSGLDLGNDRKGNPITPAAISHVTLYNQVPIPGAIWLLGSGLGAFFVARRRKKQE